MISDELPKDRVDEHHAVVRGDMEEPDRNGVGQPPKKLFVVT
jgi:hypothetical protein